MRALTLIELLIGAMVLAVAIAALLGASLGQIATNEDARNRAWATNDASRVLEQVRRQNTGSGCGVPTVAPPTGFASWDAWLADGSVNGGGGKSVQPDPAANELVVVNAVGTSPVTVAVCWRHRNRIVGECTWDGAVLAPDPGAGGDPAVTESPVMLSTILACR